MELVKEVSRRVDGVLSVHGVKVRSYGGYFAVELNLHVNAKLSVEEAHSIAHRVESAVRGANSRIIHVQTHIEPHVEHER